MADETIWIITAENIPATNEGVRGENSTRNPWNSSTNVIKKTSQLSRVSVHKLETELSKFLQIMGGLFNRAQEQANQQTGLKLDEIELSVEITGEGEIKLLGTGITTGTTGGIKLKFKKE